jgi:hypothetical protein
VPVGTADALGGEAIADCRNPPRAGRLRGWPPSDRKTADGGGRMYPIRTHHPHRRSLRQFRRSHSRMDVLSQIEQDRVGKTWSPELRAIYVAFSEIVMKAGLLTIKIGKGGLSYYKDEVFVCHFNAKPQSKRDDIGFADFRFASLEKLLHVEKTVKATQNAAAPDIEVRVNDRWCSFHFSLNDYSKVADLFVEHIISQIP